MNEIKALTVLLWLVCGVLLMALPFMPPRLESVEESILAVAPWAKRASPETLALWMENNPAYTGEVLSACWWASGGDSRYRMYLCRAATIAIANAKKKKG